MTVRACLPEPPCDMRMVTFSPVLLRPLLGERLVELLIQLARRIVRDVEQGAVGMRDVQRPGRVRTRPTGSTTKERVIVTVLPSLPLPTRGGREFYCIPNHMNCHKLAKKRLNSRPAPPRSVHERAAAASAMVVLSTISAIASRTLRITRRTGQIVLVVAVGTPAIPGQAGARQRRERPVENADDLARR